MGEAPVPLVMLRYFAIVAIVLALVAPIPFTQERARSAVGGVSVTPNGDSGDYMVSGFYQHRPLTYNATRRQASRHLAWPIVAVLGLVGAVAERHAYRRAFRAKRRAGFAASAGRALPVVGVGGYVIIGGWYAWGSAELEPSFGLFVTVAATAVLVGAFLRARAGPHRRDPRPDPRSAGAPRDRRAARWR